MQSTHRPRQTLRQELWMLVRNPVATLLFALVVVGTIGPASSDIGGGTVAGNMVGYVFGIKPPPQVWWDQPVTLFLVREGDVFRAIDPDVESWDELSKLAQARPRDLFEVSYFTRVPLQGVWAVTRSGVTHCIAIGSLARNLSDTDVRRVREEAVTHLGRKARRDLSTLATGDLTSTEIVWVGYLANVLSILCAALFVLSLSWVGPTWRWFRTRRSRARQRRGLCPVCGYSAAGLRESTCPECGAALLDVSTEKNPGEGPGS